MKAYKVFNADWQCHGYQYTVGGEYKMEGTPVVCERGFHACEKLVDCFDYYDFNPNNKVAEVELLGKIVRDENKVATNHIKIVAELNWNDVLNLVNMGKGNTGMRNTGHCNTGNWNTGDWNTGDWNTGNWNTGNWNTGNSNTGNCNTGHRNTGHRNTGNWNNCSFETGFLNSKPRKTIRVFNKEIKMTRETFLALAGVKLLGYVLPRYDENGKVEPMKNWYAVWWKNLNDEQKAEVKSIPGFDSKIFKKITGINVDKRSA